MIVTKLGKWEVGWSSLLCAVASGKVTCSVIWFLCYVLDGFAYVLCLLFIWLWWSENVTKISNELPSKWNKSKWKCIEKCIFLFQLPIGEHFFFLLLKKKFFMEETTLMIPRCTTAVVIWHYLDFYYLTDLLRKLILAGWSQILIENVLALCVIQCQQWSFSYCNLRTFSSLHVSLYWLEKLCSPAKLLLCKKFLLLQVILMKFLETASVNSLVVWV